MDDDDRELVTRLLATATTMLEDAAEVAAAGQSPTLAEHQYAACARRLYAAVRDIAVVAEATTIIAERGINQGQKNRQTRC